MGHASSGSMITLDYTHTTFAKLTEAVDQLPNLIHPRYEIADDEVITPFRPEETIPFVKGWNEVREASGLDLLPMPEQVPESDEDEDDVDSEHYETVLEPAKSSG